MTMPLETPRLRLVLEPTEAVLARIEALPAEHRAQVSEDWLAQLRASTPGPWTHGFAIVERESGCAVGSCAFKGPPDDDGIVEIAYEIHEARRGRGYATEAAAALVKFAREAGARRVIAHTLPETNASTSVLRACGFKHAGTVDDPEDGTIWRWELA